MIMFSVRCLLLCLCLLLVTAKLSVADAIFSFEQDKVHLLEILHPGRDSNKVENLALVETTSNEFYMDVPSVYCYDSVCKMDTVRVFWNNIGVYSRLELREGIQLEKSEGEDFSDLDYKKLHTILKNEKSALKNLGIGDILKSKNPHELDVDAISGATAIEIDESEFVKGAIITCYTIWHWANSSIKDTIRNISGDALNTEEILSYLSKSKDEKLFGMEQITRKAIYDEKTVDSILRLKVKDGSELNKLRLRYLEQADLQTYLSSIKELFNFGTSSQKSLYLQSLRKNIDSITKDYFESFSQEVLKLNSYQEVNLFLILLEEKGHVSSLILDNIMPLLDKDILIARRAYWYLSNQKLNRVQQKRIVSFQKKNKDYL